MNGTNYQWNVQLKETVQCMPACKTDVKPYMMMMMRVETQVITLLQHYGSPSCWYSKFSKHLIAYEGKWLENCLKMFYKPWILIVLN